MSLQRQSKPVYSFMDDLVPTEAAREWRPCIGHSGKCKRRVFGFKGDRLCQYCVEANRMLESPYLKAEANAKYRAKKAGQK